MKRGLISLAVCAALVAAAGAASYVSLERGRADAGTKSVEPPPPVRVAVQAVEPEPFRDILRVAGVVEPWQSVTLSAEVQGAIEVQEAEEGAAVEEGQPLVRIDTTALQAQRDRAQADYTLARQELDRIERLRSKDISSGQDLDRVEANFQAAQAALRLADIQLEKSVVASPIDGVIDVLHNEAGEYVAPGTPLARVVQLDPIKVRCGVAQRDVTHFATGDTALVRADAFPERGFDARIHRVATTADQVTRTFSLELAVANPEGALRPGMVCRVALDRRVYEGALVVPVFAVIVRDEAEFVFVEEAGTARRVPITTGVAREGRVVVTEGLEPGARVIVAGHRQIRDGQAVVPEPAARP